MSRIVLLPGYGENAERAFRELRPYLPEKQKIHVDFRPVLKKTPLWEMNGAAFAKKLIQHYQIQPDDVLLGHSMGGYFSYHIHLQQGNPTGMLCSFSNPAKVIHMTPYPVLTPVLAISGISKSDWAKNYIGQRIKGRNIEKIMLEVMDNFKTFSNEELFKLSLITLEKAPVSPKKVLRIHAKDDRVVRTPDEHYEQVQGGHFCLNLHPEETAAALQPLW